MKACPHENVGIIAVRPGHDLIDDRPRSSVGRYSTRLDLAALVLLLTFGAFANAAGMVAPVFAAISSAANALNLSSDLGIVTLLSVFVLMIIPATMAMAAAAWSSAVAGQGMKENLCRFSLSLVPDRIRDVAGAFCLSFVYGRSYANSGHSSNCA